MIFDDKLYYIMAEEGYVWCFDIEKKENNKTDISADGLQVIDYIDKQMYLGYVEDYFIVDNPYKFQGDVIFFVNINNKYFTYVNNYSLLYVVDYKTSEEVAVIPLEDIGIHHYNIFSIGGSEKIIGISTSDKRIDIILE